jgi:hypothetical protein
MARSKARTLEVTRYRVVVAGPGRLVRPVAGSLETKELAGALERAIDALTAERRMHVGDTGDPETDDAAVLVAKVTAKLASSNPLLWCIAVFDAQVNVEEDI